jgi:hypothetical protein
MPILTPLEIVCRDSSNPGYTSTLLSLGRVLKSSKLLNSDESLILQRICEPCREHLTQRDLPFTIRLGLLQFLRGAAKRRWIQKVPLLIFVNLQLPNPEWRKISLKLIFDVIISATSNENVRNHLLDLANQSCGGVLKTFLKRLQQTWSRLHDRLPDFALLLARTFTQPLPSGDENAVFVLKFLNGLPINDLFNLNLDYTAIFTKFSNTSNSTVHHELGTFVSRVNCEICFAKVPLIGPSSPVHLNVFLKLINLYFVNFLISEWLNHLHFHIYLN